MERVVRSRRRNAVRVRRRERDLNDAVLNLKTARVERLVRVLINRLSERNRDPLRVGSRRRVATILGELRRRDLRRLLLVDEVEESRDTRVRTELDLTRLADLNANRSLPEATVTSRRGIVGTLRDPEINLTNLTRTETRKIDRLGTRRVRESNRRLLLREDHRHGLARHRHIHTTSKGVRHVREFHLLRLESRRRETPRRNRAAVVGEDRRERVQLNRDDDLLREEIRRDRNRLVGLGRDRTRDREDNVRLVVGTERVERRRRRDRLSAESKDRITRHRVRRVLEGEELVLLTRDEVLGRTTNTLRDAIDEILAPTTREGKTRRRTRVERRHLEGNDNVGVARRGRERELRHTLREVRESLCETGIHRRTPARLRRRLGIRILGVRAGTRPQQLLGRLADDRIHWFVKRHRLFLRRRSTKKVG